MNMATCVVRQLLQSRHCGLTWIAASNKQPNRNVATKTKLQVIGKLHPPKPQGKYASGQMFVHSVFGYRGVILFPWMAKIYDRDIPGNKQEKPSEDSKELDSEDYMHTSNKEVQAKTQVYYQVLMDFRDLLFISAQSEGVSFLGNREGTHRLYKIVGLDNVSHEDVLPYSSTELQPIQHDLFDKFLEHTPSNGNCTSNSDKPEFFKMLINVYMGVSTVNYQSDPPFEPNDTLKDWQKKNHPCLELSEVHRETTEDIRVTVIPFYLGSEPYEGTNYHWRYCVRIENLGDKKVQLRERHWRIFSLSGTLETIKDKGVQGVEPVLSSIHAGHSAYQYTSHVVLKVPSGHMWGTYRMEREDGYCFDCRIPPFALESKQDGTSGPQGGVFG